MTVTAQTPATGADANARIGPGFSLGILSSATIPSGAVLDAFITYTVAGGFVTSIGASVKATAGTNQLTLVKFNLLTPGNPKFGIADGHACDVSVTYHTGLSFHDSGTLSGYTWDSTSGLWSLLTTLSGGSIADFVSHTFPRTA